MNIDDWNYYYKYDKITRDRYHTQMVYEPKVSPDGLTFCMNFVYPSTYQFEQSKKYHECYTNDFVQWMFDREIHFLDICKNFSWAPEILDIDTINRRVFMKWNHVTCNDLLFAPNVDPEIINDCQTKLATVIKEQAENGIFKLTAYPHSHFLDTNGNLRTFDFYACATNEDYTFKIDDLKALLGESYQRFLECVTDGNINLKLMYTKTLCDYDFWTNNITKEIYEKFCRQYI